jgi:hypothetical protein
MPRYVSGKLLFVHGTGVRDVAPALAKIRPKVQEILGWDGADVVPVEWGRAVGPQDLDIAAALPPDEGDPGIALGPAGEPTADGPLWDLLAVDPRVELTTLAEASPLGPVPIDPGAEPAGAAFVGRLRKIELPDEALARAEVSATEIAEAAAELGADPTVEGAGAVATGEARDALVAATARALVATTIARLTEGLDPNEVPPAVAADPRARDELVAAVIEALGGSDDRGIVWDKLVGPLATRVAMAKRANFMRPFGDFTRDVVWYLAHGEKVRDEIAQAARESAASKPLVVLGHSLGGIAAVDLLSDPKMMSGEGRLSVDLLVTVGSQAPILYLMDSLHSLTPRQPKVSPFAPWLNVYNRHDLLSFLAAPVFPGASGIVDEAVEADVPFPASHSAYWSQDRTFALIKDNLPA